MNPFKQRQAKKSDDALQQELFKEYYPLVLSIVDEIQPLLQVDVDEREVLSMAQVKATQTTALLQATSR